MRYLLDTHVLIWYAEGNTRLSSEAIEIIEDKSKTCLISIASIWEIGIKHQLNKIQLKPSFESFIKEEIDLVGYGILALSLDHILSLSKLPFHHRDPFDRMIIAQALSEKISVI
jgi:PIN domain nuclease of toxin-antitoxin system